MKINHLIIITILLILNSLPVTLSIQHHKISDYQTITDQIIKTSLTTCNISKLEYLCDTFGPRRPGTPNLEQAIDWILNTMRQEGLENVRGEPVHNITNWVRGRESLQMLSPRQAELAVLAFGNSIGTDGITAEVLVVSSFDDLKNKAAFAKGKIIVYDVPWVSYGFNVQYRVNGADKASEVGGVAALVRSVTPYSLYTTHTGSMYYGNSPKIPTAAITIEDAEMFHRMQNRGQKIVLTLKMEAETRPQVSSRNIIAEIVGSKHPEQVILMGGHVDSWDVGTGAMDDGGGIYSAWDALKVIMNLVKSGDIPRPKRTIRVVMWVDEELSGRGSRTYATTHANELDNHVLAIESDSGNFDPTGFGFTGSDPALGIIAQILGNYTKSINTTNVYPNRGCDADNGILCQLKVPGGSLISRGFNEKETKDYYFNFHHSRADMITSLNYDGLRRSVASFGVLTYVVADMDQTLPR
jgi:carboxypeptidase Q